MVKCKACGIEHPGWMTCREAKAKLGKICAEPVVEAVPEKVVETVVFKCPVCEARRIWQRDRMRAWRKKK